MTICLLSFLFGVINVVDYFFFFIGVINVVDYFYVCIIL